MFETQTTDNGPFLVVKHCSRPNLRRDKLPVPQRIPATNSHNLSQLRRHQAAIFSITTWFINARRR